MNVHQKLMDKINADFKYSDILGKIVDVENKKYVVIYHKDSESLNDLTYVLTPYISEEDSLCISLKDENNLELHLNSYVPETKVVVLKNILAYDYNGLTLSNDEIFVNLSRDFGVLPTR